MQPFLVVGDDVFKALRDVDDVVEGAAWHAVAFGCGNV